MRAPRAVLAPTLTVTRLHERSVSEVATVLLKLLLYRESGPAQFWAYSCVTDGGAGQISLIMDEDASMLFPPDALVGNCGLWRAVKLCGHQFSFDETGVVSAMLQGVCTQSIPVLNLSTFSTNITIVEEGSLAAALQSFGVVSNRVVWAQHGDLSPQPSTQALATAMASAAIDEDDSARYAPGSY
jgi:hypothetical protein